MSKVTQNRRTMSNRTNERSCDRCAVENTFKEKRQGLKRRRCQREIDNKTESEEDGQRRVERNVEKGVKER